MSTADLLPAVRALVELTENFKDLSAPQLAVSSIYNRVELSFHDGFPAADFEMWREALGLKPSAVDLTHSAYDDLAWLSATTHYAGASIRLTGFLTLAGVPTPEVAA